MLQSEVNLKNIQRIIRFFSRAGENGYIFAYAEQSSLIKEVNQALMEQLKINKQAVGLIFLKEEDSVIQRIREAAEQGSRFIIIGNLYSLMSQEKTGLKQLTELNFSRESLYSFNVPILFWITEDTFSILANKAADLYSQRRFSTVIFEKEVLEASPELPEFEDEPQAPQESTKLQLLKEQFEEALQQSLSGPRFSSEYLLPYLKELAESYQYDKVTTLFERYESQIDFDNIDNLQIIGDIFSETHDYGRALTFYSRYLDSPDPATKARSLGYILLKRGVTYTNVGNLSEALEDFEKAQMHYQELSETSSDDSFFKQQLAISYSKLGETHSALGNLDQALRFFDDETELFEQLFKDYPNNVSFKNGLAISYSKLGETHSALGNLEQALRFFEKDIDLSKELFKDYPNNVSFKNGLAISYSKLGETHSALGNLEQALRFFEQRSELGKQLFKDYPNNVSFKNGLAISYSKLGETHSALGNLEQALRFFEQRSELGKQLFKDYPNNVSFKNGLAISYSKLGSTHSALGNLDQALRFFDDETELFEQLFKDYPNNVSFKNGLAISYEKLGSTHSALGNLDQALRFFENETELFEQLFKDYPNNVSFKNGLAVSYEKLGSTHSALGNLDQALRFFENDIDLSKELFKDYPNNVSFKNGLAVSYTQLGRLKQRQTNKTSAACEDFLKARTLWFELVEKAKGFSEFQNNLSWVNEQLDECGCDKFPNSLIP